MAEVARPVLCQLALGWVANAATAAVLGAFLTPPVVKVLLCGIPLVFITLAIIKIAQQRFGGTSALGQWAEHISGRLARTAMVTAITLKLNHTIHEWGHAGAALMTFINAKPQVFVDAGGGATTYSNSYGLTQLGQCLGKHRAKLFVTAAGLMTPILMAMTEFAVAYGISDKSPATCELLTAHGMSQILSTVVYGLNGFPSYHGNLKHDFFNLWQMGDIHPLLTLSLIIALPLAQYAITTRAASVRLPQQPQ